MAKLTLSSLISNPTLTSSRQSSLLPSACSMWMYEARRILSGFPSGTWWDSRQIFNSQSRGERIATRAVEEAGRVTLSSRHHLGEHARARTTGVNAPEIRLCPDTYISFPFLWSRGENSLVSWETAKLLGHQTG